MPRLSRQEPRWEELPAGRECEVGAFFADSSQECRRLEEAENKKKGVVMHGHSHEHHTEDVDWDTMGEAIERRAEIYHPLHAQIIDVVRGRTPDPGLIVDAGSGPGVVSTSLAETFPRAEVRAVDNAPALLERADRRAREAGVAARLQTVHADIPGFFADVDDIDIMWLGQSLHHVGDQQAALTAAASSLRSGGLLVLLEGGLPARWLPRDLGIGRPGLQARLTAMNEEWFTAMRASLPGAQRVTEDWSVLLANAGLTPVGSRGFLLDLPAPVSPEVREHIVTTFEWQRTSAEEYLDADDVATLDRLLEPDNPLGLWHRPDLFLLDVQTVHFGVKQ